MLLFYYLPNLNYRHLVKRLNTLADSKIASTFNSFIIWLYNYKVCTMCIYYYDVVSGCIHFLKSKQNAYPPLPP